MKVGVPEAGEKAEREKARGRSVPPSDFEDLVLVCQSSVHKCGYVKVHFEVLAHWLEPGIRRVLWECMDDKSKRMRGSSWAYGLRKVLDEMAAYSRQTGWTPSIDGPHESSFRNLNRFRNSFYESCASEGIGINTIGRYWAVFLSLLPSLARRRVFQGIRPQDKSITSVPSPRGNAKRKISSDASLKSQPSDKRAATADSGLLEPVPIGASNRDYLGEYEHCLATAIYSIREAAIEDLRSIVVKRVEGQKLIASVDYAAIHAAGAATWLRKKFLDPATGYHFFKKDGKHPNLLANLLALVRYEMGVFPRSAAHCDYFESVGRATKHWVYVTQYGTDKLIPYLGVPTKREAVACIVVLLLEHPRFNVVSLIDGKLEDEDGASTLLSSAGLQETLPTARLTVEKWRALSEKTGILSELAAFAMRTYLDITEPFRAHLRRRGQEETANHLWIGWSIKDSKLIRYGWKDIYRAFNGGGPQHRKRKTGTISIKRPPRPGMARGRPESSFFERHPSLNRWQNATLKILRVSSGVLKFIQADGNLAIAAREFGHGKVATTIRNYIPEALLNQIHERQIRRHQNALIVWAHDDDGVRLQATDFTTMTELHRFLKSGIPTISQGPNVGSDADAVAATADALNRAEQNTSEVVLIEDVNAIAVALLYREHLRQAPLQFLEEPDPVAKLTPRFWAELVDCISADLPPAMYRVRQLVEQARLLLPHVRETTTFARFWE